ncbi:conserved hypothetical protein [Candidatus Methylobacter favarea]|uniref:PQQ-binding-like beta-propeller repeat protein n=1 Tax=Candidatus Methylobacter favarea TaxID=2707345 RepID=A0A8S0X7W8_9GAMM|nr:hypothetical protein [Candidatus Methylobacter favarea]CAA9890440.1 conserved hypothetical protein [Candidatus Methylobacter favarea]
MKFAVRYISTAFAIIAGITLISCNTLYHAGLNKPELFKLEGIFPSPVNHSVTFDQSIVASPLLVGSQGKPLLIVPASNGVIAALDTKTGTVNWQYQLPSPAGQEVYLASTPALIGNKLVVVYQCLQKGERTSHRLVVIDLIKKQIDKTFPALVLSAEKPAANGHSTVKFNPSTAFSHSAVKHASKPESQWGYVYVSFGSSGDTQPYHGWIFEIDMEAWKKKGAGKAVRNVLVTTPEAECPVTMSYGTQEMICGGGVWTPPGLQIYEAKNDFELFVPTGNGQINPARHDYANSVMRVKPGLEFDSGCDALKCANFNPANPDVKCLESCKNLFIPRLAAGNAPIKPANRECDNKTFWECLAWMDYDLGGSAPVKVNMSNGRSVIVQAGKDGGVYLIDADHLGIQHDRLQIVEVCGAPADPCKLGWAGMIVTQPVLSYIDGVPVVVIPTFSPDKTHPAGLVALKIVLENGLPKFKRFWQFPDPANPESLQSFRTQPSLPVIATPGKQGDLSVWVVDIGKQGTIYGVRIKDGALIAKAAMQGTGRPLSRPVIYDNYLYLASLMPSTNKAMIEAYRIELRD